MNRKTWDGESIYQSRINYKPLLIYVNNTVANLS